MKSTTPDALPRHPDALREMVVQLLQEREEKDREYACQVANYRLGAGIAQVSWVSGNIYTRQVVAGKNAGKSTEGEPVR